VQTLDSVEFLFMLCCKVFISKGKAPEGSEFLWGFVVFSTDLSITDWAKEHATDMSFGLNELGGLGA
jgi:hypothetical protein